MTTVAQRVPPHNLDAERAYLGAAMMTITAAELLTDGTLTPADFYPPPHQAVAGVIAALTARREHADPITVAHNLDDTTLAHIRHRDFTGRHALLAIQTDTPATANARQYAHIIATDAHYRRLIAYAGEISDAAYQRHTPNLAHTPPAPGHDNLGVVDLTTIGTDTAPHPTILPVTGGTPLIYPGKHHDIHGEPATGKSWIALAACAHALELGGAVIWIDYEDIPATFLARAHAIGIPDHTLRDPTRVRYCAPAGPLDEPSIHRLLTIAADMHATLAVIDAGGGALANDTLDDNSNRDVLTWTARIIVRLNRNGTATVNIDHQTKDPATRTRGSRGAGAKLQTISGASYAATLRQAFSRTHPGHVRLTVAKDRGGHRPTGSTAADIAITPDTDGTITLQFTAPDTTNGWRPTHLMEQISRLLESRGEPLSRNQICDAIPGRKQFVLRAIDELAAAGHIDDDHTHPTQPTRRVTLVQPFATETDEPE